ncbi:aminocarboxymuconate-semialdehyde decarboxylase [Murinocardiopsis flavida]|uniref:Aminocarboxymuconate-semialdehyde decarboxylase n=1 Tax=Murinocardiopsis flavida TaxID=645275 RepID=A0A2P8CXF7_9ACTN|nr:amidohydrolase family protein [Murinocardiopsis flavida]PSK89663.1 aminocarboxymuconate-semialdehyde decarboxylase [Murinocardiopsis flavida]
MTAHPATDVHTHLAPLLGAAARERNGVGLRDGRYVVADQPVGPDGLYRPEGLTAHLAAHALDRAIVSVPPPFFRQGRAAEDCRRWAADVNDGLLAAVDGHGGLSPLAYLPLDRPDAALAEYRWRRGDPAWAGFSGAAGGGSPAMDAPELAPLWDAMAADGAAILLHPGLSTDPRLARHYLGNLLGNPVESTVSAAELVFGGVLHRYQGIAFILAHCGGATAALAGRWQRGYATGSPGVAPLDEEPSAAVRRFYVDALAHEPAVVDLAAAVIGTDRIVLASDWPFPMGVDDPHTAVAHLPAADRERIARTNPAELFGGRRAAAHRGERP